MKKYIIKALSIALVFTAAILVVQHTFFEKKQPNVIIEELSTVEKVEPEFVPEVKYEITIESPEVIVEKFEPIVVDEIEDMVVVDPLIKIEKCKIFADTNARVLASSAASDAEFEILETIPGVDEDSSMTFTEKLNNLNYLLRLARAAADSVYNSTYLRVYNDFYLSCLAYK